MQGEQILVSGYKVFHPATNCCCNDLDIFRITYAFRRDIRSRFNNASVAQIYSYKILGDLTTTREKTLELLSLQNISQLINQCLTGDCNYSLCSS